ncbi:MAG: lipoprotein-releasing ABC transporter permease subunit [Thermodesulfobacteriota bacterium]
MAFEYFIGGRYLKSRHKQGFISFITVLSMAGVAVGVMALIIVIAVMTGAESYFKSKILGVEPHVVVRRHGDAIAEYRQVIERIQSMADVNSTAPFVETQVMLRSSNGISGAVLRGVDPAYGDEQIMGMTGEAVQKKLAPQEKTPPPDTNGGDLADRGERGDRSAPPGIVLGKNLARKLGVGKGDALYLISPRGMMSPIGHMPSMKRFSVTGVFSSGFYEYDASLAYVHLNRAQQLMKIGDAATGIGLKIDDMYAADEVAGQISDSLDFPYWTMDWMEMNQNFFSALKLEKEAMFVILTLIILVAAFNIASTLIMMVMSKTRDIAILKAMGATDKSIRKIFVFKGMTIGVIGTAIGTGLGVLGAVLLKHYKFIELPGDVYYFTSLPVQLEGFDILAIIAAALVICFLATLYPARKASKLNPVEALRYG